MSKELGKRKQQSLVKHLEMYMDYQDIQLAKKRLSEGNERVKADDFFKELGINVFT